jgi:hypothetical protein
LVNVNGPVARVLDRQRSRRGARQGCRRGRSVLFGVIKGRLIQLISTLLLVGRRCGAARAGRSRLIELIRSMLQSWRP